MIRLFALHNGDFFRLADEDYQVIDSRKQICKKLSVDEEVKLPSMIYVEKIDKPKKRKKTLNESEPLSDSVRLRDGLVTGQDRCAGHSPDCSGSCRSTEP